MGDRATSACARRAAPSLSDTDACGDKPEQVPHETKAWAARCAARRAADSASRSRAPPARKCESYGDRPGGAAQLRGPCTNADTHTHARKHARARRHAHTHIHTRTRTHTHARTLARAQKHTLTHAHTHARLLNRYWLRGARLVRPAAPSSSTATGRTGPAAWARTRGICGRCPATSWS